MPKLLPGLSIAAGILTVVTATHFSRGGFGAFGPQRTGGFRPTGGFLIAFAVLALVVFVAASALLAERNALILVAGLAAIDGLANAFFVLASRIGFSVPSQLHWATGMVCSLVFFLALLELMTSASHAFPRLSSWPLAFVFTGAGVGGVALLIGIGRYEWGLGVQDTPATAQTAIAVAVFGLMLFALGAGGVVGPAFSTSPPLSNAARLTLSIGTIALCGITVRASVQRIEAATMQNAAHPPSNPWLGGLWLLLAVTQGAAILVGASLIANQNDAPMDARADS